MVFVSMLDIKVSFFFFFSSYIIVGCTVNYVIIPLPLDIWVVWNVSDLGHRPSSSKDAAFLVGPLGAGCFLTLIAWGQEVVSPSLPPLAHPPTTLHEKPSFEHYVSFCDSLPFLVDSLTASLPIIHPHPYKILASSHRFLRTAPVIIPGLLSPLTFDLTSGTQSHQKGLFYTCNN